MTANSREKLRSLTMLTLGYFLKLRVLVEEGNVLLPGELLSVLLLFRFVRLLLLSIVPSSTVARLVLWGGARLVWGAEVERADNSKNNRLSLTKV